MKSFALALGGGGARGLGHIAVIEALDEMGVRPAAIAGASMGALIGAAYAAGMTGKELRHHVITLAHNRGAIFRGLMTARSGRITEVISSGFGGWTLVDAEKFVAQFLPAPIPETFSRSPWRPPISIAVARCRSRPARSSRRSPPRSRCRRCCGRW